MEKFLEKISSRKFIISAAAFLGSLGTGITGLATDNTAVALAGGICMVISAALYAGAEAYVDAAAVNSETLAVSVNANTTNKDTTKIVDQVLNKNEVTVTTATETKTS